MSDYGQRHRPQMAADPKASQPDDPKYVGGGVEADQAWARERIRNHFAAQKSPAFRASLPSHQAPSPSQLQRKTAHTGDWRKRLSGANGPAPGAPVAAKRSEARAHGQAAIPHSGGAPLGADMRSRMEGQLGADLSSVKVHTGGESADTAADLGARAFTVGQDVHFGAGEFAPGTKEGDRLIAHELTHTVQAQRSGVQRKADAGADDQTQSTRGTEEHESNAEGDVEGGERGHEVSQPGDPAEKEADAAGDRVAESLHGERKGRTGLGSDDKDETAGDAEKPAKAAPGIAAKLKPGVITLKKKDEPTKPSSSSKLAGPATAPSVSGPKSGMSGGGKSPANANQSGAPRNDAAAGAAKPPQPGKAPRVTAPVPGLYDSIHGAKSENLHVGQLKFSDKLDDHKKDHKIVETAIRVEGGEGNGDVGRSLLITEDGHRTLQMDYAFLDNIPPDLRWVTEDGKPLVKGKGIPLQAYVTMRQMKILGIEYGDLGKPNFTKVKMSTIVNERTIFDLAEQSKKKPGATEFARIKQCHSYQYAETVIIQAGAKIVNAKLDGGPTITVSEYVNQRNQTERKAEMQKRGLSPSDPLRRSFDIILEVAPFTPSTPVPATIADKS